MPLTRLATDSSDSEWRPVPEGLWRWRLAQPKATVKTYEGNKRSVSVLFTLALTEEERARLTHEHGEPPEGTTQRDRAFYRVGYSLGYFKQKVYVTTKMVDFMASLYGQHGKRFRAWVETGGGPRVAPDATEGEELDIINAWLEWFIDLEVFGSIRHEAGRDDPNTTWAVFGGPLAVGSLPGQRDDAYQALALGKLRAMIADCEAKNTAEAEASKAEAPEPATASARSYAELFGDDDGAVASGVPADAETSGDISESFVPACEDCGGDLKETRFKDGTYWTVEQLQGYGRRKYGKTLCMDHYRVAGEARKAAVLTGTTAADPLADLAF